MTRHHLAQRRTADIANRCVESEGEVRAQLKPSHQWGDHSAAVDRAPIISASLPLPITSNFRLEGSAMHEGTHLLDDLGKGPLSRSSKGALPDDHSPPARLSKRQFSSGIPISVSLDLCSPEIWPGRWQPKHGTAMPMPEATVDEHGCASLREHKIRPPGQLPDMEPVTQSGRMKPSSQQHLRFRVASTNPAHVVRPLLWSMNVHQACPTASETTVRSAAVISPGVMPGRSVTAPNRKPARYEG